MPNAHDDQKIQTNVWLLQQLYQKLQEEAEKEGKTLADIVREQLHARYPDLPYSIRSYYNPGGWVLGRSRRTRAKAKEAAKQQQKGQKP